MVNKIPNILYTTKNNLCTMCGVCEDACPSSAIKINVDNGVFRPYIDDNKCNNDKGCHRCYDVCPGVGVNLLEFANKQFSNDNINENKYIGCYIECYTGYSNDNDLRFHAASGGLLSQFVVWLLESKKIDGVVVTKFDKESELFVKSFIATTKEEVIQAKSSKYSPVTLNNVIREIKNREGKFVIVGLPCHIHGFRKYAEKDKSFSDKIFGYFGLYCSGTRNFYLTEYVLKERKLDRDKISYLAYRDEGNLGGLVVEGIGSDKKPYHFYEDYQSYCHPLRSIFTPRRCFLCIDHFAELADISFGDIHTKPYSDDKIGINSIVVRNQKFNELLHEAKQDGVISLEKLPEKILLKSQPVSKLKKERTATYIMLDKMTCRRTPRYDCKLNDTKKLRSIVSYIKNSFFMYVGRHKLLWRFIPYLKAKVNIH